ncbi:conserved protein of unknown function [Latilactobacillus sakei]|nr:conserved protein of unknown function [Latilactobacillus sakei]
MSKMIHSKYGYETREATGMFARLDKWVSEKKKEDKRRPTSKQQKRGLEDVH